MKSNTVGSNTISKPNDNGFVTFYNLYAIVQRSLKVKFEKLNQLKTQGL